MKISDFEKKILRDRAKSELERMEDIMSNNAENQVLRDFKDRFNICETVYKVILAEHQRCKGKTTTGYLKLDMRQIPHALRFAGYDFSKDLLIDLFGKTSPKGTTAKKLRDATTHGIDEAAVSEIMRRKDELFGYMDQFLSVIRTYDEAVA